MTQITAKIEIKAEISQYDRKRCSRDCPFCGKTGGNYRCYLRKIYGAAANYDEIEGFDGFDDFDAPCTADSYGFKRTPLCLKLFDNSEDIVFSEKCFEVIGNVHDPELVK